MVRGRKRDPTSTPSRSLIAQREYRARKAQYTAELEARFERIETENDQLRQEVARLRLEAGSSGIRNSDPHVIHAAMDLLTQLSETTACISSFVQVSQPYRELAERLISNNPYQGATHLPTPAPSEHAGHSSPEPSSSRSVQEAPECLEVPNVLITRASESPPPSMPPQGSKAEEPSVSDESVCCWGYFDCGDDSAQPAGETTSLPSKNRKTGSETLSNQFNMSDMRSTS